LCLHFLLIAIVIDGVSDQLPCESF
jgi:hypothetical protein